MRTKATHFVVYILIRAKNRASASGGGIFDMFRYDSCLPATEAEAAKLERVADDPPEWIMLRRFVPIGGTGTPTAGRWQSFGWECDLRTFQESYAAEDARRGLVEGAAAREKFRKENPVDLDAARRACEGHYKAGIY